MGLVGKTYVGPTKKYARAKKGSQARERRCKNCGHIQGHHAAGAIGDHRQHECREPGGCKYNCSQFVPV